MNEQPINGRWRGRDMLALALLLLIVVVPRVIRLSADPPDRISPYSCGEYGDPASYAANARNAVLFGHAKIDDFNVMYASPVGHLATYAIFRLFGPGMRPMNLQPVLFSVLLFGCLFVFARRHFPTARWLFFILLTLNYPFIVYGRIADQIMPMTLFAALGLFLFLEGWERPALFLPAALSLGLSFASKGKIVYLLVLVIPLSGVILLLVRKELRLLSLNLRRLGFFAAGALSVFLPWLFIVYLPNLQFIRDIGGINAAAMFPRKLVDLILSWLLKPPFTFYGTNKLFSLLLFLYFLALLLRLFNKKGGRPVTPLEIVSSLWFVIGVVGNSVISYRPTRHYIELTVPMVILASLFLKRLLEGARVEFEPRRKPLFYACLFLLLWGAVTSFSQLIFTELDIVEHPYWCLLILTGLAGALFALAAFLVNRPLVRRGVSVPRRIMVPVVAGAIGVYALQNVIEYAGWARNPTYNLKRISRDFGAAFPGSVFAGLLAPAVSMENRNVAHVWYPNFANYRTRDFLIAKKVRLLFLGLFNKESYPYWMNYPHVMRRARFRARYKVWRSWFDLFEVEDSPVPEETDTGRYEAEKLERDFGLPLFDRAASNQFSVWVDSRKEAVVLQKRLPLKPGETALLRLRVRPEAILREGPFLLVRLTKGKVVHYRQYVNLYDPQAEVGHGFLDLDVKVDFPRDRIIDYDLKVSTLGNYAFALDTLDVRVEKASGLRRPGP